MPAVSFRQIENNLPRPGNPGITAARPATPNHKGDMIAHGVLQHFLQLALDGDARHEHLAASEVVGSWVGRASVNHNPGGLERHRPIERCRIEPVAQGAGRRHDRNRFHNSPPSFRTDARWSDEVDPYSTKRFMT